MFVQKRSVEAFCLVIDGDTCKWKTTYERRRKDKIKINVNVNRLSAAHFVMLVLGFSRFEYCLFTTCNEVRAEAGSLHLPVKSFYIKFAG